MDSNNQTSEDQTTPVVLTDIRGLDHAQLEEVLAQAGQPKFRVKQLEEWIVQKGATSFDQMTNLPASLREFLSASYTLTSTQQMVRQISQDGSRKYLLRLNDGAAVECVGMPNHNKLSVCVSTQAGCRMGCIFCATGAAGFERSLSAQEMYDQVTHVRDDLGTRVTSVVFMGQGEPFANYDQTLEALRMLNSPDGLGIGARHLTVSTCGIVPMIRRFAKEPEQFTLAVSLHSAIQKTRNVLMPGVRKYSLGQLYECMADYVELTGRRPTYEYALINGINDTNDDIDALCDFTRGTLSHVNLIQLNDNGGGNTGRLKPSTPERAELFVRRLGQVGVEATIRNSRGDDIDAACGQLRQRATDKA